MAASCAETHEPCQPINTTGPTSYLIRYTAESCPVHASAILTNVPERGLKEPNLDGSCIGKKLLRREGISEASVLTKSPPATDRQMTKIVMTLTPQCFANPVMFYRT